jgi:hypothetical protein
MLAIGVASSSSSMQCRKNYGGLCSGPQRLPGSPLCSPWGFARMIRAIWIEDVGRTGAFDRRGTGNLRALRTPGTGIP